MGGVEAEATASGGFRNPTAMEAEPVCFLFFKSSTMPSVLLPSVVTFLNSMSSNFKTLNPLSTKWSGLSQCWLLRCN